VGCRFRLDQREVAMTSMGDTAEADVVRIGTGKTLRRAGHRMRELGVAALAVCGEDGQFLGIITRGMVVDSIAAGSDPKTVTVGEVAFMRRPSLTHIRGGRAGNRRPAGAR
jgi:CBS domain-containing protein